MSEQKVPAKNSIEKAVLNCLKDGVKLERRKLISASIEKHGFSAEQLKDRSCESLSTELKSLTGVVINEMLAKEELAVENNFYFAPVKETVASTDTTDRKNEIEKAAPKRKRRRRKKPVLQTETAQKVYPDTELGKILAEANKKYLAFKSRIFADEIKKQNATASYNATLKRILTQAINVAGGEFFEELSMKLLKACYGDSVVKDELTAGPEDNGIDGILTVKDAFGFEEKVYFQSKTKLSERKNVSIKVARELLGVMTADKVSKGIVITNSTFVKDTRAFASKAQHLALVDVHQLFDMMCKYGIGVKKQDGILLADDDMFLNI